MTDYMKEVAVDILTRIGARSVDAHVKAIAGDAAIDDRWRYGPNEERAELLTHLLYDYPSLVLAMFGCQPRPLVPVFIVTLSGEAVRAVEENACARPEVAEIVNQLLGTSFSAEPLPAAADRADEAMRLRWAELRLPLALLTHTPETLELCDVLKIAVPFCIVLHRELDDVAASRKVRLADDPDTELSLLRREQRELASRSQSRQSVNFKAGATWLEERGRQILRAMAQTVRRKPATAEGHSDAAAVEKRCSTYRAEEMKLVGMACSGGGIRSATFCLGAMQGLSELGLLRHVDYLSTVSGGGYAGGFLAALIRRTRGGVRAVQSALSPEQSPDPNSVILAPLRFLREYSNYLTPSVGFFSADTWTLVAVWFRNTLLIQLVLLLALAAAFTLPRLVFQILNLGYRSASVIAVALLLFAAWRISRRISLIDRNKAEAARPAMGAVQTYVAAVFLAALFGSVALHKMTEGLYSPAWIALATGSIFLVILFVIHKAGKYNRCFVGRRPRYILGILLLTSVGTATVGGLMLYALLRGLQSWPILYVYVPIFGPPVLVGLFAITVVIQLGLLGADFPDERRECWSSIGAWLGIYMAGWLVWMGTAAFGPLLALTAFASFPSLKALLMSGWIGTTVSGVIAGRSARSRASAASDGAGFNIAERISFIAPYVFAAGLLVLVSLLVHVVLRSWTCNDAVVPGCSTYWSAFEPWRQGQLVVALCALAGSAGLAILLGLRVDINEFSMHHFYKNRLVRCYLGATRGAARQADFLTGFDRDDDIPLASLRPKAKAGLGGSGATEIDRANDPEPYVGPYPIINATLNLVKGDELAWQERKGESFVLAPRYSGFDYGPNRRGSGHHALSANGYRPTEHYAYPSGGIHLGTSIAISGAAASPNHGYQSSPATAFLLTVFNARLGWWLGNPRHARKWRKSSPRSGLGYLLNELFGRTNDCSGFVNLSDGGHFDNLGLYELIRRRCRFIIVCDAEQDGKLTFGSLGAAIRKCRTDFGADIDIDPHRITETPARQSSVHCVVGSVRYATGTVGKILYLKSSVTGDEPYDVLQYRAAHSAFPHEPTADQWFSESQFESYRALGHHVAMSTLAPAVRTARFVNPACTQPDLVEEVFRAVELMWYPPSVAIERHFAEHARNYSELLAQVRQTSALAGMDPTLYPAEEKLSAEKRELFYMSIALIELMQMVYVDLRLGEDQHHPHNAGWMTIFRQWAQSREIQQAWRVSKDTYGDRFRQFCAVELGLE